MIFPTEADGQNLLSLQLSDCNQNYRDLWMRINLNTASIASDSWPTSGCELVPIANFDLTIFSSVVASELRYEVVCFHVLKGGAPAG